MHQRGLRRRCQVGKSGGDAGTAVLRFEPAGGQGPQPSDMEVCEFKRACRAHAGTIFCTSQTKPVLRRPTASQWSLVPWTLPMKTISA